MSVELSETGTLCEVVKSIYLLGYVLGAVFTIAGIGGGLFYGLRRGSTIRHLNMMIRGKKYSKTDPIAQKIDTYSIVFGVGIMLLLVIFLLSDLGFCVE